MNTDILTKQENGILTITFNRTEKKNAISTTMYQTMADILRAAETNMEVRVILFTGSELIFTAGNDLEDFIKNTGQFTSEAVETSSVVQFMLALSGTQKPVIAAVAGFAVGIGTTLLLHCDLVYLADNAKLSMPFSQLGLCPEFAASMLLPQVAGHYRAAEKLLFGEPFSAQEALEMGLANKILPAKELLSYVYAQAAKLVALPAPSILTTKRLLKASQHQLVNQVMQKEMQEFIRLLNAPEAKTAFLAFFQKH